MCRIGTSPPFASSSCSKLEMRLFLIYSHSSNDTGIFSSACISGFILGYHKSTSFYRECPSSNQSFLTKVCSTILPLAPLNIPLLSRAFRMWGFSTQMKMWPSLGTRPPGLTSHSTLFRRAASYPVSKFCVYSSLTVQPYSGPNGRVPQLSVIVVGFSFRERSCKEILYN